MHKFAKEKAPHLALSEMNFGFFPMVNHQSRLQRRFYEEVGPLENARGVIGQSLDAPKALALGLVLLAVVLLLHSAMAGLRRGSGRATSLGLA